LFCRGCGQPLKEGAEFCGQCGTKVAAGSVPPTSAAAPVSPDTTQVMPPVTPAVPPHGVAAAQQAAPARRTPVGLIIAAVVVVVLLGGGVAAWALGAFDPVVEAIAGDPTAEDARDDNDRESGAARDSEADEDEDAGDEGSSAGEGEGDEGGESGESATLSAEDSYEALVAHYDRVWALHAEIGLQDPNAYTGTGFVFDPGGFNEKIGHPDLAEREALVEACRAKVERVTSAREELAAINMDSAYAQDKTAIMALYDYLFNRTDAMYQAALAAVENPDRDTGWGSVLQPRSKDNRAAFEAAYPGAEPVRR